MSARNRQPMRVTDKRSLASAAVQWLRVLTLQPRTPSRLRWCAVLFVALAACGYAVATATARISAPVTLPEVEREPSADATEAEAAQEVGDATLAIENRQFTPHTPKVAKPKPVRQRQSPQLASIMKLQGIFGSSPPRAILYDLRTKTTHSVVAGQSIGEIEVVEILATKVILRLNDQTVELTL